MKIASWRFPSILAGVMVAASCARAALLPLIDPGFDATVASTFTYNSTTYTAGSAFPQGFFTGANGQTPFGSSSPLNDSATGTLTTGAVSVPAGYTGTLGGSGIVNDPRYFNAGSGPTGPGGTVQSGAIQTLVAPAAGGTTTATLDLTTGVTAPVGNLGFKFSESGFAGGAASQVFFDNISIDATTVPEPVTLSLLSLGGMILLRRTRRTGSVSPSAELANEL